MDKIIEEFLSNNRYGIKNDRPIGGNFTKPGQEGLYNLPKCCFLGETKNNTELMEYKESLLGYKKVTSYDKNKGVYCGKGSTDCKGMGGGMISGKGEKGILSFNNEKVVWINGKSIILNKILNKNVAYGKLLLLTFKVNPIIVYKEFTIVKEPSFDIKYSMKKHS